MGGEADKYEALIKEVSKQGEAIRAMDLTMSKVADALTKIASLETHRDAQNETVKELKENDKDIFARLRTLETNAPVTKLLAEQSAGKWNKIGNIVLTIIVAALLATIGLTK